MVLRMKPARTNARDSEQGQPRSEAVVSLKGEGAKRLRGDFIECR